MKAVLLLREKLHIYLADFADFEDFADFADRDTCNKIKNILTKLPELLPHSHSILQWFEREKFLISMLIHWARFLLIICCNWNRHFFLTISDSLEDFTLSCFRMICLTVSNQFKFCFLKWYSCSRDFQLLLVPGLQHWYSAGGWNTAGSR